MTKLALLRPAVAFYFTGKRIDFEVFGLPAPQGSKRGFVKKARFTGKPFAAVVDVGGPGLMIWRQMIIQRAREARVEARWESPLQAAAVFLEFYFPRPANHAGAKGLLASAPLLKVTEPDLDKLVRAVYDALTDSYVVLDDRAIVTSSEFKAFGEPGAKISVRELALRSGQVPLELAGPDGR